MTLLSSSGEPSQDPYALLGLAHDATDDDIGKAFKKLMLRLHPDKQPAGQTEEEAAAVAEELHLVMEAKSFLLDGEHLTARRAYDDKLKKAQERERQAAMQFPLGAKGEASAAAADAPKSGNPTMTPPASATAPPSPKRPDNHKSASQKSMSSSGDKKTDAPKPEGGGKHAKEKEKPSSYAKKNVTVKQWGRPARPKNKPPANRTTVTRRSSDGDKPAAKADPAKKKTPAPAKFNRFNDSCGDCSTTDDCSSTSDDDKKKHSYSNKAASASNRIPTTNRPNSFKARNKVHSTAQQNAHRRPARERKNSDADANGNRATESTKRRDTPSSGRPGAPKSADFSTFQPALDQLEKQYHCPLTGEVMKDPMSDFEGNSYERAAILKYLETHNTSPVTGSPLFPMHLTPNSAMREKIRYTLKLKDCLESLKHQIPKPPTRQHQPHKYKTLREAVDHFIKEINTGSPNIRIDQPDASGVALFSYLGLKFLLDVPGGKENDNADNIIVQTWFGQGKKCAGISGRVVGYNAALQQMGLGECRLTFRNTNGKHAFTLTQKLAPEEFSKTKMCHGIEYFVEMAIKLHNIINTNDVKKVGKVRLTST